MRDVRRALIDQLQWFCLQHEAKKFLTWFCFKNDGFSIETVVKEYFVRREIKKSSISKYQAVVNISNVTDEEMVVGEYLVKIDGPNLFADRDHHQAKCWGEGAAHWTTTALANARLSKSKGLHVKGRFYQPWYILDENLSGDIESSERASFDDVPGIIGFSRIDGEHLVVGNIHFRTKKVQEHEPGTNEPVLINTGKEASKVLVDQDQIGISGG